MNIIDKLQLIANDEELNSQYREIAKEAIGHIEQKSMTSGEDYAFESGHKIGYALGFRDATDNKPYFKGGLKTRKELYGE